MSLISWDDIEEFPTVTEAKDPDTVAKAAANIANLDLGAAYAEQEEQRKAIELRKSIQVSEGQVLEGRSAPMINGSTVQNIEIQYHELGLRDKGLADRVYASLTATRTGFERGEAPKVEDKRLINAVSDLNQLVPFKYEWAWTMYLDSCEKHWMPTEINILRDIKDIDVQLKDALINLMWAFNHSNYVYNGETLVNIYRLITNPECRQYLLRLGFEDIAFSHAIRHLMESFNINTEQNRKKEPWHANYITTNRTIYRYLSFLNNPQNQTKATTDIKAFTLGLTATFAIKQLYCLAPLFTLWKLNQVTGRFNGVKVIVEHILRDLGRQVAFGQALISGILEENPEIVNQDLFSDMADIVYILKQTNINTPCGDDSDELKYIVTHLGHNFLTGCGVTGTAPSIATAYEPFVNYYKELNQKDYHNASAGLAGENTKGTLQW